MTTSSPDRALRILLSAYTLSCVRGSEPGNSWRLAEGLARAGHHVTVITTSRYPGEHDVPPDLADRLILNFVDARAIAILRRGQLGVYANYRAWQRHSLVAARALISSSSETFDVIHHYSWGSLFLGSPLAALDLPFVFGPVGGGSTSPNEMKSLYRSVDQWKERFRAAVISSVRLNPITRHVTKRASLILAANSDTADLLNSLGGNSSLMMQDTTPAEWLGAAQACRQYIDRSNVIWVARAMPRKGILLAVMVASRLPASFTVHVVGDGKELNRAKVLTKKLGLESRVVFHGLVPWTEVLGMYDLADVMLFTSIRDTFGSQILDAASRGLPVVAIRQQGVGDFVPASAGHLVALDSPAVMAEGMAEAIIDLCSNEDRYRSASAAARSFAEEKSLSFMITELVASYQNAIRTYGARGGRAQKGAGAVMARDVRGNGL